MVPAEEYFESSPHLFALNKDGDRRSDMLCLSEPETVNIAVKTIKDTFRDNLDTLSFGFAPPDRFPMCYCQRCHDSIPEFNHKGYGDPSLSDLWFRFANCIAKEVYEEFPDRWVLTNGYANRVRLPEGIAEFSPNLVFNPRLLLRVPFIMRVIKDADSIHFTNNCWIGGPIHSTVCLSMIMARATL